MKLLLGINLLLAIIVVAFLLLREDGRSADQNVIPRVAAETEKQEPASKTPDKDPTSAERVVVPTKTSAGENTGEPQEESKPEEHPELIIEGVVLDPESKPVMGYWVQAHEDGEGSKMVAMGNSDKKGHFRFRVPKEGEYLLTGTDTMRWVRTRVLASLRIRVKSGDRDVRIQLGLGKSGEIHALLTGFGKLTIPARVQIVIKNEDKVTGGYHRIVNCPDGIMKIPGIAPGRYKLKFFIPDLLTEIPLIQVHAEQVTDLGRIYFHPQGAIAGIILDAKGRPFPDVDVYAKRPYSGWLQPRTGSFKAPKASTKTDSDGRFATTGYRDPWTPITFTIKGYAPIEIFLTSADQARTLRLHMRRQAILEVRDFPRSTQFEGKQYPLTIWNLKAIRLPESYALWKDNPLLKHGVQSSLPGEKNSFTIPDLPPGRYRIRLLSRTKLFKRKLKKFVEIFVDREIELNAGKTFKLVWK